MRAVVALSIAACAALSLPAGPAVAGMDGDDASVTRGRALAERFCARCHAIGAEGTSPFDPAPPFRVIARRYEVSHLAEAFAEGIVVGHPAMPAFEFGPLVIGDLLAYLDSLADGSEGNLSE